MDKFIITKLYHWENGAIARTYVTNDKEKRLEKERQHYVNLGLGVVVMRDKEKWYKILVSWWTIIYDDNNYTEELF